jgi:hypothetical protein
VSAVAGGRALLTRGVHGLAGRWLVNGSSRGLVAVTIEPPARAFVVGFPVRLRVVTVSVEDPEGLIAYCGRPQMAAVLGSAIAAR